MLRFATIPALALLAACGGQSNEDALEDAANQSDPAAAAVLENAADNGMDPQAALEEAGEAAAQAPEPQSTLQARPNLPTDPNRPTGGEPPEKVDVEANSASEDEQSAADEHAGHNME